MTVKQEIFVQNTIIIIVKWPYFYGLRFDFVSKPDILYSLFFEEFIGLIKYWQVQGQILFWFILAKEFVEFRKKNTTEFDATGNGSNVYVVPV